MKPKISLLARITAFFLILFILGGYFSMVSRFLGEQPGVISETLFLIGVFGSVVSGLLFTLNYFFKKKPDSDEES